MNIHKSVLLVHLNVHINVRVLRRPSKKNNPTLIKQKEINYRSWILLIDLSWGTMTIDGGQPSVEDNILCKTTFDWRLPLMRDALRWKMSFNGRQPLMEENFYGRHHQWRQEPLVKDWMWLTFDGTLPLIKQQAQEPWL